MLHHSFFLTQQIITYLKSVNQYQRFLWIKTTKLKVILIIHVFERKLLQLICWLKRKKQIMNAAEKLDTVHISLYHKAKTSIFIVYIYAMIEKSKDNTYSNCPYTELTQ